MDTKPTTQNLPDQLLTPGPHARWAIEILREIVTALENGGPGDHPVIRRAWAAVHESAESKFHREFAQRYRVSFNDAAATRDAARSLLESFTKKTPGGEWAADSEPSSADDLERPSGINSPMPNYATLNIAALITLALAYATPDRGDAIISKSWTELDDVGRRYQVLGFNLGEAVGFTDGSIGRVVTG